MCNNVSFNLYLILAKDNGVINMFFIFLIREKFLYVRVLNQCKCLKPYYLMNILTIKFYFLCFFSIDFLYKNLNTNIFKNSFRKLHSYIRVESVENFGDENLHELSERETENHKEIKNSLKSQNK